MHVHFHHQYLILYHHQLEEEEVGADQGDKDKEIGIRIRDGEEVGGAPAGRTNAVCKQAAVSQSLGRGFGHGRAAT